MIQFPAILTPISVGDLYGLLPRLTAQKITQTGQPLRGQDGVRYIYFDTYDNRMVYESSDETPRNEPTFRLLADADCPAVLVEQ